MAYQRNFRYDAEIQRYMDMVMKNRIDEINDIFSFIKPVWVLDNGLAEAWQIISQSEKQVIQDRVNDQFKNGFPFELKAEKNLYIYLFSFLTECEIIGTQIPLRYKELSSKKHSDMLHQQLLDEVFHTILFAKIVSELSAPYAYPPESSKSVIKLSKMIKQESGALSIILTNIITECWIEQMFLTLKKYGIAPAMFDVVLQDEQRHISEAALYKELGLPSRKVVSEKLAFLEDHFVSDLVYQENILYSLEGLIGKEGCIDYTKQLDARYKEQLSKIGLKTSQNWNFFIDTVPNAFDALFPSRKEEKHIKKTPVREVFSSIWDEPRLPTMSSSFSIDVSRLEFFEKKYPSEALTILMMQAFSKMASEHDMFRNYIYNNEIYQPDHAYFGLAIYLPEYKDHLGCIEFKDCHKETFQDLAIKIKKTIPLIAYCFKRCRELEKIYPHLALFNEERFRYNNDNVYPNMLKTSPSVKFSNVGHWGYEDTVSPLMPGDTVKITVNAVQKKQVWNQQTKTFEPRDIVNVSMSGDHRVFDGNIPAKKLVQEKFHEVFDAMKANLSSTDFRVKSDIISLDDFKAEVAKWEQINVDYLHKVLHMISFTWKDYKQIDLKTTLTSLPATEVV